MREATKVRWRLRRHEKGQAAEARRCLANLSRLTRLRQRNQSGHWLDVRVTQGAVPVEVVEVGLGVVVLGVVVESQAVWGCVQWAVLRVAMPGAGPRLMKKSCSSGLLSQRQVHVKDPSRGSPMRWQQNTSRQLRGSQCIDSK